MDKLSSRPVLSLIFLILLSSHLFFFNLGRLALTDPDETFYAQTAKEMAKRGEWITPYLYNQPQFEKPILFYWLVEASFKVFGVNEFAARFPSAVFGLIGVIAVYLLGSLLYNKRAGLISALILATNVEYVMLARACVTDMVLGTFFLLGFLFFLQAHKSQNDIFYILSAVAFALATMTKGPIGVILPAVIIALYLAVLKDAGIFRKWTIMAAAFLAFLAVVLPWYIIIYKLHGKAFVDVFFGIHNITRFLEPEHKAGAKIYYYIPVLLGGFFPWSAFLPFGLWRAFKGARSPLPGERRGHVFLLLWFVIIFVFFSAASTRLPTYIFPAFAAAALIVGRAWDEFLDRTGRQSAAKGLIFSYWLLLLAAIAGAAGLCIFIRLDYPILVRGALASGGVLLSGFLFSAVFFMKKRFFWAFLAIIASIAAFIIPLNRFVVPEIERYEASKEISAKLIELMKPGGTIGAEKDYLAGVSFYTGKDIVPINWHHELVRLLEKRGRAWCVLKEKNHIQLYTVDTKPQYLRPSYMVYKLGKKCIITNLPPEDGVWLAKRERAAR